MLSPRPSCNSCRKHKWEEQERQHDRDQRIIVAEDVKQGQLKIAAELKKSQEDLAEEIARRQALTAELGRATTKAGIETIVQKIETNTAVNEAALKEANNMHQKILAIGGVRMNPDTAAKTDHITEVVEDTNRIVHATADKKPRA